MFTYNGAYKSVEIPFSEDSKFYIDNLGGFVSFSVRTSANFGEQYQTELIQEINNMFDFKEFNTNSTLVFTINEVLDRLVDDKARSLFVYLIVKCMYTKRFCGTLNNKIEFTEKDLKYKKAKFVKLLNGFPLGVVKTYAEYIYSSIIDSAELTIGLCEPEPKSHKFAYKVALIAKEYLDDLEAFVNNKVNEGYPRINKKFLKEQPLEKAYAIIKKAKEKLI